MEHKPDRGRKPLQPTRLALALYTVALVLIVWGLTASSILGLAIAVGVTQLALVILGAKVGTDTDWAVRHRKLVVWASLGLGVVGLVASYTSLRKTTDDSATAQNK